MSRAALTAPVGATDDNATDFENASQTMQAEVIRIQVPNLRTGARPIRAEGMMSTLARPLQIRSDQV